MSVNDLKIFFAEGYPWLHGRLRKIYRGHYYSQFGEDEYLLGIMGGKNLQSVTYLDIGAAHPIIGSNTFLFYQNGASGITVDANPYLINRHKKMRPRDKQVHTCVGSYDSHVAFDLYSNWSFSKRSDNSALMKGVQRITVPQISINSLLTSFNNNKEWFLSLDVEGLEVEILESANFDISCPRYCLIEVTKSSFGKIEKIMENWGFVSLGTLGMTSIYKQKSLLAKLDSGSNIL